jgi:glycolate oxidase iron-sulfur subunit
MSDFDTVAALEPLMDKCVHCGFCLSTCPSYVVLGQEMDSPRGRIYLMRAGVEGRISMTDTFVEHFDRCLGCMACETACPSGVRYAPLIEETRLAIESSHRRSLGDRLFRSLLFMTLPHPARLRLLALPLKFGAWIGRSDWIVKLLPTRLRMLLPLASSVRTDRAVADVPERVQSVGEQRMRVGLLTGCVQRVFFSHANAATMNVLAAEGCEVVAPPGQGCCGALALHAGLGDEARARARALIATFESAGVDRIVVNAAGCGSAMKEYGHLLRDDPAWAARAQTFASAVCDVTELLADLGPPRGARHPVRLRAAYHEACHLAHAQGVRRQPRAVLESIPELTITPLAEADLCCGSAGIFNLVEPEMAGQLGDRKAGNVIASGADVVVTTNPGCILQIDAALRRAGRHVPVVHVVELLEASMTQLDSRFSRRHEASRNK